MTTQTKDLLKRLWFLTLVFLSGGAFNLSVYLYVYPPTHEGAQSGSLINAGVALVIAVVCGWFAIKPRPKKRRGVEVGFQQVIPKGTRIGDAEGRVFITTEDATIGEDD